MRDDVRGLGRCIRRFFYYPFESIAYLSDPIFADGEVPRNDSTFVAWLFAYTFALHCTAVLCGGLNRGISRWAGNMGKR